MAIILSVHPYVIVATITIILQFVVCRGMPNDTKYDMYIQGTISYLQSLAPISQCIITSIETQCSTAFAQNYINNLSKCGTVSVATIQLFISNCQINQNGYYCGTLSLITVNHNILKSCPLAYCSDECLKTLEWIKNKFGCCANSHLSAFYNRCSITPPPSCQTTLQLPQPTKESTCSSVGAGEIEFIATCEHIHPVINMLNGNNCTAFANQENLYCSSRNGQYCLVDLEVFRESFSGEKMAILKVEYDCSSELECTSQCYSSLTWARDKLGCCIHAYASFAAKQQLSASLLEDNLWKLCNVTKPEVCLAAARSSVCHNFNINSVLSIITFYIFS